MWERCRICVFGWWVGWELERLLEEKGWEGYLSITVKEATKVDQCLIPPVWLSCCGTDEIAV